MHTITKWMHHKIASGRNSKFKAFHNSPYGSEHFRMALPLHALYKCPNTTRYMSIGFRLLTLRLTSGFSDLRDFNMASLLDLPLTVTSLEVTLNRCSMHYDN